MKSTILTIPPPYDAKALKSMINGDDTWFQDMLLRLAIRDYENETVILFFAE